jgi:hypothetical protein
VVDCPPELPEAAGCGRKVTLPLHGIVGDRRCGGIMERDAVAPERAAGGEEPLPERP